MMRQCLATVVVLMSMVSSHCLAGDGFANGLPTRANYFPIAVWLQDPKNADRYRDAGINLYVGLWDGPTQKQLDALSETGMGVICEQNDIALKNLETKTIVGWMQGDEPDNAQELPGGKGYGPPIAPEKVLATYQKMHAADPTRPVILNLGQGVAWDGWFGRGVRTNHPEDYAEYGKGCDIASFDIYPAVHDRKEIAGKLWYVGKGVDCLIAATENAKPVWACIETTHIGNAKVLPTPAQVRSEVWMAIIHGARGIIYFSHEFKPKFIEAGMFAHPEIVAAVKDVDAQITRLAPILNAPSEKGAVTAESSNNASPIKLLAKRKDKVLYIFAIADRESATNGSFTVAGMKGNAKVEVIDENRTIDLIDGRFEDHFDGYGVHLYRIGE